MRMKKWLGALLYGIAWPVLTGLSILPPTWIVRLGRWAGNLAYVVDSRHRRVCLENLGIAFPGLPSGEKKALARRCFQNISTTFLEIPSLGRLPFRSLLSRVRCEGLQHLQSALAKNRGVLILTGHIGNWELMAFYTGILGYRLAFVARALDFSHFNRWLNRVRQRSGNRVIPKRGALRPVLRSLRQGYAVGLLVDQRVTGREGLFVDFFGHQAGSSAALALLACRYGAPVLPAYIVREPSGLHHRFFIGQEIPVVRTGRTDLDIRQNTEQFQKILEGIVREHPDQWFWMHRRWKGSPTVRYSGVRNKRRRDTRTAGRQGSSK